LSRELQSALTGGHWFEGELTNIRLLSTAGPESTYDMGHRLGRGLSIWSNGASIYVTKCREVEVPPLCQDRCMHEIHVTPAANLPLVSMTPAANLPRVSMTTVENNGKNIRLHIP